MIPHLNLLMLQRHIKYIGNNKAITLTRFNCVIEDACGVKAKENFRPIQSGDVPFPYADISCFSENTDLLPKTEIGFGISSFMKWFKDSDNMRDNSGEIG